MRGPEFEELLGPAEPPWGWEAPVPHSLTLGKDKNQHGSPYTRQAPYWVLCPAPRPNSNVSLCPLFFLFSSLPFSFSFLLVFCRLFFSFFFFFISFSFFFQLAQISPQQSSGADLPCNLVVPWASGQGWAAWRKQIFVEEWGWNPMFPGTPSPTEFVVNQGASHTEIKPFILSC